MLRYHLPGATWIGAGPRAAGLFETTYFWASLGLCSIDLERTTVLGSGFWIGILDRHQRSPHITYLSSLESNSSFSFAQRGSGKRMQEQEMAIPARR